jgi:hypothetical protein
MASRDRLTGGELNGALTDELVGVQAGYLGHGPQRGAPCRTTMEASR